MKSRLMMGLAAGILASAVVAGAAPASAHREATRGDARNSDTLTSNGRGMRERWPRRSRASWA